MSIYLGNFTDKDSVGRNFQETLSDDIDILFAWYDDVYGYSGDAFVLYRQGGKLYEVTGSHCSCYGLEGQWEPEETSFAAIRARPYLPSALETGGVKDDFLKVLDALEQVPA